MVSDLDVILDLTNKLLRMTETRRKMEKLPITAAYVEGYKDGVEAIRDTVVQLQRIVKK